MAGETLRVIAGELAGRAISLDDQLLIGREAEGDGQLGGDPEISAEHASIRRTDDGGLLIEDLGSTNGTVVNGRRISGPLVVRAGDKIEVGMTTLEVVGGPGATRPRQTMAAASAQRGPSEPPPAPTPVPVRGEAPSNRLLWLAAALILVLAALSAFLLIDRETGNNKSSSTPTAAPAAGNFDGVVYVESNLARGGQNSVLSFLSRKGSLRPLQLAEYPTGGSGSADLGDTGVLDADQQMIVNPDHSLLFAVNQGSDSIAVFHIESDGRLRPVSGSPFPSGGAAPASVGLKGDTLIVVNKAQDGIRDLKTIQPNYTTFKVGKDGSLTPTGSTRSIPPGSSPTQALVTSKDGVLVSTEEGGPFRAFRVESDGSLKEAPNSPLQPDDSIFPPNFPKAKRWGLGIGSHPKEHIVYIQMATVSKMAVYSFDEKGKLTFVRAVDNPGSKLPCWTLVNRAGTRLYTANAGNNTVSVFDIASDPRRPKQLQLLRLKGDGNPWNIQFSQDEKYIFLVVPRAVSGIPPGRGNEVHTLSVRDNGTVTELDASPVSIPVPLDTNPIGIGVVNFG